MSERLGDVMFNLVCVLVGLLFVAYVIRNYRASGSSQKNGSSRYGSGDRDAAALIASGQVNGYDTSRHRHDDGYASMSAHQMDRPSDQARLDDAFSHLHGLDSGDAD